MLALLVLYKKGFYKTQLHVLYDVLRREDFTNSLNTERENKTLLSHYFIGRNQRDCQHTLTALVSELQKRL